MRRSSVIKVAQGETLLGHDEIYGEDALLNTSEFDVKKSSLISWVGRKDMSYPNTYFSFKINLIFSWNLLCDKLIRMDWINEQRIGKEEE